MITTVKQPCCERIQCHLISMLFQLTSKNRRSGMDRRNLGTRWTAGFGGIPAIWIPAIHAGMTQS